MPHPWPSVCSLAPCLASTIANLGLNQERWHSPEVKNASCQVEIRRKATNQCSDSEPVVPVSGEVGDGHSGKTGADPVEQLGFGRVVRLRAVLVMLRPAHRDRVVQNERPDQTHDQLFVVIHDVRAV